MSDSDLRKLIVDLENDSTRDDWEPVIGKSNDLVSYYAKCCKTQDGPLKYVSVTTFENCSSDLLRDFYTDNEYRRVWDKTVVEYEQLQINEGTGVEIGRMIKKFPLLSPREYVLAWCVWEGKDESFYCITKDCEHPLAPRKKKYVRVKFYFSGWKIKKVPGRDASEIKIVYQEDAGMNVDIAKVVFAKGIWSYVCKMDSALRKYSSTNLSSLNSSLTILNFMQKVPADLEIKEESLPLPSTELSCKETKSHKLLEKPSRKTIAKGLVLLGGAIFLTRNHASIGAKFAMFCIVNNLVKNRKTPSAVTPGQTEPRRVSWIRSSLPHWPQK